jgi:hypothetical protein
MRTQTYHAMQLVIAERDRQVDEEGWSASHDDEHGDGELALAAALYALPHDYPGLNVRDTVGLHNALELGASWTLKPEPDRQRALVKAGALILAELERLERAGA